MTSPSSSARITSPVSSAARRSMPVPTSGESAWSSGTAWACMFEPISARFASSCSRNGMRAVVTDQIWFGETSIRSTSFGEGDVALADAAVDRALELAVLRHLGVRLGDHLLALLGRVVVHDLAGHDAVLHDPVGRGDEAVLRDLRVARERADQADVRTF